MSGKNRTQHRNILNQRNVDSRRQHRRRRQACGIALQPCKEVQQKNRTAAAHQVNGDTRKDNIRFQFQRKEAHNKPQKRTDHQRAQHADQPVICPIGKQHAKQRGNAHNTLQTDIGNTGFFRHNGRQSRKQYRGSDTDNGIAKAGCKNHADQLLKHYTFPPSTASCFSRISSFASFTTIFWRVFAMNCSAAKNRKITACMISIISEGTPA